jgi:hypothetical protein
MGTSAGVEGRELKTKDAAGLKFQVASQRKVFDLRLVNCDIL